MYQPQVFGFGSVPLAPFAVPYPPWQPGPLFPVATAQCQPASNLEVVLPRTSTPVCEPEEAMRSSCSVSEFFYQSWKSDLHSDVTGLERRCISPIPSVSDEDEPSPPPPQIQYVWINYCQPVYIISQPVPTPGQYHSVGYRTDGTYGVLPTTYCPYYV